MHKYLLHLNRVEAKVLHHGLAEKPLDSSLGPAHTVVKMCYAIEIASCSLQEIWQRTAAGGSLISVFN